MIWALQLLPQEDRQSFMNKTVWQRFSVIAAGPLMNFILAVLLFIIVFAFIGIPGAGNRNIIGALIPDRPAVESGLQQGDRIVAVDNILTPDWNTLTNIIHAKPNQSIVLSVQRGQEQLAVTILTVQDEQTGNGIIGIQAEYAHIPILQAIAWIYQYLLLHREILISLIQISQAGSRPNGGPGGDCSGYWQCRPSGLAEFLMLTGLLSVNLGLLISFQFQP